MSEEDGAREVDVDPYGPGLMLIAADDFSPKGLRATDLVTVVVPFVSLPLSTCRFPFPPSSLSLSELLERKSSLSVEGRGVRLLEVRTELPRLRPYVALALLMFRNPLPEEDRTIECGDNQANFDE